MTTPGLYNHQAKTIQFYSDHDAVLNHSDPGTGKTRATLEWFRLHRENGGGKGIVFAPKSILQAAWGNDAKRFTPEITVSVATAENRHTAFSTKADLYITNIDALRALVKDRSMMPTGVDTFVIDESTSLKNPSAQRTKAATQLLAPMKHRILMSGTPAPQGVLDLWSQAYLADHGERLGASYYKFRATVCEPVQVGAHQHAVRWQEKPGVPEAVADMLGDITVRFQLEDVLDMPERIEYYQDFALNPKHFEAYEDLRRQGALMLSEDKLINPIHAAALRTKLLQLLSGAVYTENHLQHAFSSDRYDLVLDLAEARPASLVAFNWRHQRDGLIAGAKKRDFTFAVIDGATSSPDRLAAVEAFQQGKLKVLFAHPQTAGHGLTLTAGSAVIWTSPTDNAELYQQFNARLYRAGQTKRTEIIKVIARDTIEDRAYHSLDQKMDAQSSLLSLLR
jgi:SNF2 family DNA or RNA helicase